MTNEEEEKVQNLLKSIAWRNFRISTLANRNSDELDFYTVAVWEINEALRDAYIAGMKAGKE